MGDLGFVGERAGVEILLLVWVDNHFLAKKKSTLVHCSFSLAITRIFVACLLPRSCISANKNCAQISMNGVIDNLQE
jgi:dUTPase